MVVTVCFQSNMIPVRSSWRVKVSMLRGISSIGWTLTFSAKFSEWIPNASKPIGSKHVEAAQALVAPVDVGARERVEVPDVQPLGRGVREHHQVVERVLGPIEIRLVGASLGPQALPLLLGCRRFVHHTPVPKRPAVRVSCRAAPRSARRFESGKMQEPLGQRQCAAAPENRAQASRQAMTAPARLPRRFTVSLLIPGILPSTVAPRNESANIPTSPPTSTGVNCDRRRWSPGGRREICGDECDRRSPGVSGCSSGHGDRSRPAGRYLSPGRHESGGRSQAVPISVAQVSAVTAAIAPAMAVPAQGSAPATARRAAMAGTAELASTCQPFRGPTLRTLLSTDELERNATSRIGPAACVPDEQRPDHETHEGARPGQPTPSNRQGETQNTERHTHDRVGHVRLPGCRPRNGPLACRSRMKPTRGTDKVNPAIAIALLNSLRATDTPDEVIEDESFRISLPRRLGLNEVVDAQMRRYAEIRDRRGVISPDEYGNLLQLIDRRPDAVTVFASAGRNLAEARFSEPSRFDRLRARFTPTGLRRRKLIRAMTNVARALEPGAAIQPVLEGGADGIDVLAPPLAITTPLEPGAR